ncbi:hypothetical protein [Sphingobacterium pedocola]|uniref:hypothetical protein n=1 Tax=Sphingobacterium pedocola TaxID=2082722 RepID=UPI001E28E9AB|nr:hypothetical protein [Sphingobacterium pedocola]
MITISRLPGATSAGRVSCTGEYMFGGNDGITTVTIAVDKNEEYADYFEKRGAKFKSLKEIEIGRLGILRFLQ